MRIVPSYTNARVCTVRQCGLTLFVYTQSEVSETHAASRSNDTTTL